MRTSAAMSAALAWPFLLLGNLACNVMGMGEAEYRDLVPVNSLVWTAAGVLVLVLSV